MSKEVEILREHIRTHRTVLSMCGEPEDVVLNRLLDDFESNENKIAELEEQLKNAIVPKFKIGQEVFYLKHLVVVKGKIQDILTINNGFHYNFVWDDYEWIKDDKVFATKEEAEQRLKEIKNG